MNQFARPGLGVTELPPVNADDNGKVLGVSDGAWAKVAVSGGGVLVVNATGATYECDKTAGEMLTAFSKGPVIIISDDGGHYEVVIACAVEGTSYSFTTLENEYKASSAEGYPSIY